MKLTIWFENGKFMVSGYRFFATCDKLYINDKLAREIQANTKLIFLDVYEIGLENIKSEKNNMGSINYVCETISIYTLAYLMVDRLIGDAQDTVFKVRVIKE
jgi:hypothetical protein